MSRHDISIESFDLSPIIKQSEEVSRVKNEIRNQYDKFILNFKELQSRDDATYPKITFESCTSYHHNIEGNPELKLPLKLQQLDIQFIRTCRNQE